MLFVSTRNYYNAVHRTATTLSYIRGETAGCLHACKELRRLREAHAVSIDPCSLERGVYSVVT
jgi:hypothetical protein